MRTRTQILFLLLLGWIAWAARAEIYVVDPWGTGDFPTIQTAIDACIDGDEIILTDGTFAGPGNRDLDFDGKEITVRSGSGNPEDCRIDCEGNHDFPHRGFRFYQGEGLGSRIGGITITGGYAYSEGPFGNGGGAVLCEMNSSPHISDCIFEGNYGSYGGACYLRIGSAPEFEDCVFAGNQGVLGAGLLVYGESAVTLWDCSFEDNIAEDRGAAVFAHDAICEATRCAFTDNQSNSGGALYLSHTKSLINQCHFLRNSAVSCGGATYSYRSESRILNTEISGNRAAYGGGLYSRSNDHINITHCTIRENYADDRSGGFYSHNGMIHIEQSQFLDNRSYFGSGGLCIDFGNAEIEDCFFSGNRGHQGGALHAFQSDLAVTRTGLYGNSARVGGGIFLLGSKSWIIHCTIAANTSEAGGDAIRLWDSSPSIAWTLMAFNKGGEIVQCNDAAFPQFERCDLFGNEGGDWIGNFGQQLGSLGNISADPLFCDFGAGDLTLHRDSPCVLAEDMLHGPIGAYEIGCGYDRIAASALEATAATALSLSPNPFGAATRLAFTILPSVAPATLTIHDPSGRLVREWRIAEAGMQMREWDGTNQAGVPVQGGVYFCRLQTGSETQVKQVTVLR